MSIPLRPLRPDDTHAIIRLAEACLPVEKMTGEKFARYVLLDPAFTAEGAIVATDDSRLDHPIGFVYATARRNPIDANDAQRGFITTLFVDAQFRRQGVGARLIEAAEQSLRHRGRSLCLVSPYGPSYFTPGIDVAAYPAAVALFEQCGYTPVSRPISMQTDLSQVIEPQFVSRKRTELESSGGRVEPYSPRLTRAVLDFASAEFGVDWHDTYRQAMLRINQGLASPDCILVASDASGVLGISHWEGERFGPIGVASSQRSRGIGQILMFETLARQRAAGHAVAWFLWSDDGTARRLYDNAGFREVRRFVVMRREIA